MGIEIEKRFVVNSKKWNPSLSNVGKNRLNQGYLYTNSGGWTTRVRIVDDKQAYLTLKLLKNKCTNYEFEYEIPFEDGKDIMNLCKYKLSKTRYKVNIQNHQWVVDCFHESNSPLILAEVELESKFEKLNIPEWCAEEVTGISKWSNASLAKEPIAHWSIANKQE